MLKPKARKGGVELASKTPQGNVVRRGSNHEETELPEGWAPVRVGELGMGRTENIEPAEEPGVDFELWSVPSFPSGAPEIVRGDSVGSNKQRVIEGDVLLCKINPRINRVWCVSAPTGKPQIASTEWIVFRSPVFSPDFLMWRFRAERFREQLHKTVAGVGGSLTRARPQDVAKIEIALPPVAEQRRIAVRLKELEARSRRARAPLDALPPLLAQARQSLLASAFRGSLTADWRAKNQAAENGDALLNRLRTERRKNWQASELRKLRARGKEPSDSTWMARYVEPHGSSCGDPIPSTWKWASLLELEEGDRKSGYGVLKPGPHEPAGIPMLKSGQIRHGWVDLSEDHRISTQLDLEFAKTRLRGGEVLINLIGASIGRSAVAPDDAAGCNLSRAIGMIPVPRKLAAYVQLVLGAPVCQRLIEEKTGGSAQGVLNMEEVRSLSIPLPPESEQREIVRRLDAAFARLDAAVSAHTAALAELDRLDASLLAKAFRGELVPQDPADEPAAITLQRLRTPREVFDPFAYLFQFIPALLRASEGTLPFARALEGCALLRLPRDLVRLLEPIAGAQARQHFERFAQPLNDGSFEPVLRKLIDAGAITHEPRANHLLRLSEAKAPPIALLIAEDARHVATVLALVPAEALEDLTPRQTRKLCPKPAIAVLAG